MIESIDVKDIIQGELLPPDNVNVHMPALGVQNWQVRWVAGAYGELAIVE